MLGHDAAATATVANPSGAVRTAATTATTAAAVSAGAPASQLHPPPPAAATEAAADIDESELERLLQAAVDAEVGDAEAEEDAVGEIDPDELEQYFNEHPEEAAAGEADVDLDGVPLELSINPDDAGVDQQAM
jgi:hypothetical protein